MQGKLREFALVITVNLAVASGQIGSISSRRAPDTRLRYIPFVENDSIGVTNAILKGLPSSSETHKGIIDKWAS